jgi:chemotaxis protein MotB
MAGKGGGAWKVAYADFVTAMMAFFMVMWLTSQSSDVKEAVAEHFRNPSGKRMTGSEARSLVNSSNVGNGSRRTVKSRGSKKSEEEAKHREMSDEGERSNVGKIIRFELNSFELTEEGKQELLQLMPELEGKQHRIDVRGHAANNGGNPEQSALDAWTISFRRAIVVSQFLTAEGIDPRRIRVSAAGHSEPRFKGDEVDPELDSRVEVFVLSEIFEDPSSQSERLISNRGLDAEAIRLDLEEKARAAAEEKPSGGH